MLELAKFNEKLSRMTIEHKEYLLQNNSTLFT